MSATKDVFAVVTGASSGIGKEFARLFAQDGINLVLAAREAESLTVVAKELKKQYKIEVYVSAGDLSKLSVSEALHTFVKGKDLRVEYLVNSAGFGDYGEVVKSDWSRSKAMIDLNVATLSYLSKVFAEDMRKRGEGRIVNVAGTAGFVPGPLMAMYYASKAYVLSFSQALNYELKDSGVSVTTLCPGPTATSFAKKAHSESSKLYLKKRLPSAMTVAMYGYNAMLYRKPVAIVGFRNKASIALMRIIPRRRVVVLVANAHKRSG